MSFYDQKVREKKDWKVVRQADSMHMEQLILIIQNEGFEKLYRHSAIIGTDLTTLFLHGLYYDKFWDFFVTNKFLIEQIKKGYFTPKGYSFFVDRKLSWIDEDDIIYGAWYTPFEKGYKITNLKYPENVDSLRKDIGLGPIKDYAKRENLLLPNNFIE